MGCVNDTSFNMRLLFISGNIITVCKNSCKPKTGLGIRSFAHCSHQMKDYDRFAQIAQDKWETVSDSLRSLMICEWANRSFFWAKRSFALSLTKNDRFAQLFFVWLKSYFFVLYVFSSFLFLNELFAHSLFINEQCERIAQVVHQKWVNEQIARFFEQIAQKTSDSLRKPMS